MRTLLHFQKKYYYSFPVFPVEFIAFLVQLSFSRLVKFFQAIFSNLPFFLFSSCRYSVFQKCPPLSYVLLLLFTSPSWVLTVGSQLSSMTAILMLASCCSLRWNGTKRMRLLPRCAVTQKIPLAVGNARCPATQLPRTTALVFSCCNL